MYRYILRESCSQFDALPLTSLTHSQGSPADALVGDHERESGLSASGGAKARSQSTQLVSADAVDAGTSFTDAIGSDFGSTDPVSKYGALEDDGAESGGAGAGAVRRDGAKPCACGACGTCCLMTLPSTPAQVVALFLAIAAIVVLGAATVGTAAAGAIAFGVKAQCNTLDRTTHTFTQTLTPDDQSVASLQINVAHAVQFGRVTIALQTDEEAAAQGAVITVAVDVTVPAGVIAVAVTNPFEGSPSPCGIPEDTTCASASYSYSEDEETFVATLAVSLLAADVVSGGARCETSALRITIPQETIVQVRSSFLLFAQHLFVCSSILSVFAPLLLIVFVDRVFFYVPLNFTRIVLTI